MHKLVILIAVVVCVPGPEHGAPVLVQFALGSGGFHGKLPCRLLQVAAVDEGQGLVILDGREAGRPGVTLLVRGRREGNGANASHGGGRVTGGVTAIRATTGTMCVVTL